MTRSPFARWLIVLAILLLLGAGALWWQQRPPTSEDPPPVPLASVTPGERVAPDASSSPSATRAEAAPATPSAGSGELPAPSLFDQPWADRALWDAGLVESARPRAAAREGATIYHLRLDLDASYRHFSGEQELHYTNTEREALEEIYFRLFPNLFGGALTVASLTLNGQPLEGELVLAQSALRVPLPQPLAPGASVVLGLAFQVEVPEVSEENYGAFAFTDGVLALAHAYPLIPAYDESGWNVEIPPPSGDVVYADSSFYLVEISAPAELVLATSGVLIDEQRAGDRVTRTFVAGPARDFYIAGSPHYEALSEQRGETTLRSYALPGQEESSAEVLRIGAEALALFDALYGPYPYTELELAPTPNLALGIEYPGVVVMTGRLYEEGAFGGGASRQAYLESTVVHEVGHQWFYSTVGNDQLDAPWLDEALAQYVTYRYYESLGGTGVVGFEASLRERWQRVGNAEIPIGMPVASYSPQEYGAIVYGRGPLFFVDGLEKEIGREAVDEALRAYYDQFYFDSASSEALRAVAERTCDCDLGALWAAWVLPEP